MNDRICIATLIAGAALGIGCGEVTAEPIRATSLAITSVDVEVTDSADPYACDAFALDSADSGERTPFIRLGELAYAGRCTSPAPGAPTQCWYTGDSRCEEAGRECGGFESRVDTATGEYQLAGGQHMLCAYGCTRDEDCPAAASGTARVACMHEPEFDPATGSGQCMLRCDAGETCPDGFVCIDPGLTFHASDGTPAPAPAQCVQLHRLTLTGVTTPP